MTRYEKITISLPSRAAENARRAVKEGRAESVSAYVVEALEKHTGSTDFDVMLEQMLEETGGPMASWEERAVDRMMGLLPNGKPDPNAPRIRYAQKILDEERRKHEAGERRRARASGKRGRPAKGRKAR